MFNECLILYTTVYIQIFAVGGIFMENKFSYILQAVPLLLN